MILELWPRLHKVKPEVFGAPRPRGQIQTSQGILYRDGPITAQNFVEIGL